MLLTWNEKMMICGVALVFFCACVVGLKEVDWDAWREERRMRKWHGHKNVPRTRSVWDEDC